MPQFAAHIAAGIYTGDLLRGHKPLRYGLVIGSFAPDLDFIPLAALYLFDPKLARSFHRSASHSLLLPAFVLVVSLLLYLAVRKHAVIEWGVGLALGLISHIALDLVFWFSSVQVLWPLDHWGISSTIDIWRGYTPPTPVYLVISAAGEFLFYGGLFLLLRHRAARLQTDTGMIPILHWLGGVSLVVFGVYVVLVFLLSRATYEEVVYGATTFVFAPLSLYLLWKLRRTVAGVPDRNDRRNDRRHSSQTSTL